MSRRQQHERQEPSQHAEYQLSMNDGSARSPTPSRSTPVPTPSTPFAQEDSRLLPSPSSPNELGSSSSRPGFSRRSPLNPSSSANHRHTFNGHSGVVNAHSSSSGSTSSRPGSRSSSIHPLFNLKSTSSQSQYPFDPTDQCGQQQQLLQQQSISPGVLATLGFGAGSAGMPPTIGSSRGSMILYKLADDPVMNLDELLQPPRMASVRNRDSVASSSGDESVFSMSGNDSKYPSGMTMQRGLVPYVYDPALDEMDPPDEEDFLHDPDSNVSWMSERNGPFPWRGVMNVTVLTLLILGLLLLFIFYPVLTYVRRQKLVENVEQNSRFNGSWQAPMLMQLPQLIDLDTPEEAITRVGFDGREYELVFSDEFNKDGRSFYAGDDPFWEAADLWYGATGDLEWYDPRQVTTKDGHLVITIDSVTTTESGLTHGSTAPFSAADNHELEYRSGMIQTWNKFCFTSGYIEVSVTFPGDENSAGYWPGAWTMGNLARPGYGATTDGVWPYTYDTCDLGTFPNQTLPDGSGPAAALFSSESRERYQNELSWLSGQRLSACSCPDSNHPGPRHDKGRGAPEIDIFEASRDKSTPSIGGTVSQSAQFAPFGHDYSYYNSSPEEWENVNSPNTWANRFKGSAVQQSVSGVSRVPSDMFQGSQQRFTTFGFEYWADPNNREDGYIWWQVDGKQTHRMGARAVRADPEPEGSGVGDRLIPEEPMAIVLNLGMSSNWQTISLPTMRFPGEMLVDYVRVYQRKGAINVGCDPKEYPTRRYIEEHMDAYMNPNMSTWEWEKPRNFMLDGC